MERSKCCLYRILMQAIQCKISGEQTSVHSKEINQILTNLMDTSTVLNVNTQRQTHTHKSDYRIHFSMVLLNTKH